MNALIRKNTADLAKKRTIISLGGFGCKILHRKNLELDPVVFFEGAQKSEVYKDMCKIQAHNAGISANT